MERVSISRLKDQLSAYLKKVQAGHPVLIMDRGKPVARLERADPELDDDARYRRLVAAGIVRPAKRQRKRADIRPVDMGPSPGVLDALLEERREGR
ncbi:MAG: type II toxin-antitoxin system Phd/YefM family antitoxin [Steroidobacteraceae bacterium]